MNRIFASPGLPVEYQAMQNKISDIDLKLSSIFNRLFVTTIVANIMVSLFTIGSLMSVILPSIALTCSGSPIYPTLVKSTFIYMGTFGVVIFGMGLFMAWIAKNTLKNNPV